MKSQIPVANYLRKLAPVRAYNPNLMPESSQTIGEFYRLVIGAATREQRIQMRHAPARILRLL
jgi:hypothetical protein